MRERRKHFLINKPLQLRYMAYITFTLLTISVIAIASLYIGIWGSVLDSFSDEKVRNDFLVASRLTQYEQARLPSAQAEPLSPLSLFKQSEKLSQRQREIFRDILNETNRKLLTKLLLLLIFIAWGSVYLSHKIAGPLYRFYATLEEMEKGNMTTRIHLRKYDEAQFLAIRFNQTLQHFDSFFAKLKGILREKRLSPGETTSQIQKELDSIKTSADSEKL